MKGLIHIACFASSLLLGLGLVLPAISITPGFAELDPLVKLIKPEFGRFTSHSFISIISTLFVDGYYFLSGLLFVFSVLFPLWKLGVVWKACFEIADEQFTSSRSFRLTGFLGKFSMLDVLVLAILVVVLKGLPGGGQIEIGPGAWAFGVSVFLSILAQSLLVKLSK